MSKKLAAQNLPKTVDQSGSSFVRTCFHILFFITPLLLWPFTTEVFEFNKMIFVYLMTTIITTGWLVNIFKIKKLELVRTPLDLPLLLFFLSQLASTILSINPHTSLWGYYSRFHGGLMSTISYILLYYAFVNNFKNNPVAVFKIIKTILATAVLTSIYAVAEHFGIDKNIWVQDVQNRVFSTLGQPNWLSAYLIAILPLPLYLAITNKNNHLRSTIYYPISGLFLLTIIYTKSQSGLGATAIIFALFFFIFLKKQKNKTLNWLIISVMLLGLFLKKDFVLRTFHSLNKINPFYSNTQTIINEENKTRIGGSDSMSIRRVVWEGALKLGQKYPFFGTGVETFGYSYYWVRPLAHNYTSETDFLYNKAHNEYLNFLATTGFIGLFTYLYLIFSILRIFYHLPSTTHDLKSPLLLGFISILITNYFGFSVVNIGLFFFLFPAIYLSTSNNPRSTIYDLKSIDPFIPSLIVVLLALFCLVKIKNIWLADIYYGKGKTNLEANEIALKLNPSEPLYLSQLGFIQSVVASQVIFPQMSTLATAEAELKKKAQKYFDQYVNDSITNTQKAVTLNEWNLNLYKNKARTELNLARIDPKYNDSAIKTLLKIIELSPTDPANYYNLGVLYKNINKTEEANLAFKKTLELFSKHQGAINELELQKNPTKK